MVGTMLTMFFGFAGALPAFDFGAAFGLGAAFGSFFFGASRVATGFLDAGAFTAAVFLGAGAFFAGALGSSAGSMRVRFEVRDDVVGASSL